MGIMQVGFALGSGGAATVAQIGVLEEVEAAGIRATCVAGASGGAIMGAALCAGQLTAFRDALLALNRRRVLSLFDPQWPRMGMLEGRRAMDFIRPYLGERIEELDPRFAAIATDLDTGFDVALREGDVATAVRASIAIPGILTPRVLNGRLLVDGGLSNPIPVSTARELGATFVIAVNVLPMAADVLRAAQRRSWATPLSDILSWFAGTSPSDAEQHQDSEATGLSAAERRGLVDVILESGHVAQCQIAGLRMRHEPPDFLVTVAVPRVGVFDFHRSAELLAAGRESARAALPALEESLARREPVHRRLRRWIAAPEPELVLAADERFGEADDRTASGQSSNRVPDGPLRR